MTRLFYSNETMIRPLYPCKAAPLCAPDSGSEAALTALNAGQGLEVIIRNLLLLLLEIFTDTFQKLSFFQADGFFFDTSVGKKKKKIKN